MTTTLTEATLESFTNAYLELCGDTPHDELVSTAARELGTRLSNAICYLRRRNLRGE